MSAISEKVRQAIFVKTNVPAVVGTNKLTAIFADRAVPDAVYPYGIFSRQASEPIEYAFQVNQVLESDIWLFKTYSEKQAEAESLLTAWINELGHSLTLTGNTVVWCARVQDAPISNEQLSDRFIYGRGALIRIAVE